MSASSSIFSTYLQRSGLGGTPLSQVRPEDAVIYTTLRPKIKGISTKESLPTAKFYDALADVSMPLRSAPIAIGEIFGRSCSQSGAPLIGLTSILYCMIGLGRARDSLKQMRNCEKIGDVAGAKSARIQVAESGFLVGSSVALTVVRIFGAIQELFRLLQSPLVLSPAMAAFQTAGIWGSTLLFVIVYTLFTCRQIEVLKDLSKGNNLRKQLLESSDPIQALREIIDEKMFVRGCFSDKQCTEMALDEGAKWLERLEKEGKDVPWEPTLESRQEHARQLFLNNPAFMMAEMGVPIGFKNMTPEGRLIRFGTYIGEKRLCAKIENDLKRLLGPEAIEAFNKESPDRAAFEKILKSADWSEWGIRWKTVLKIGLAVLSAAAIVAATVFSGGLALGIPLLILGVTGILWIILADGAAFKSQWESGEVRKWDKFLVYFSIALSVVALSVIIAFTIISGGAPLYIAGIIFATAWILINLRAGYDMIDNQRRPWKYQKQVTIEAFRKFLETKPSNDELGKIWNKMSKENQQGITKELLKTGTIQKAAEIWEEHLQDLRDESLAMLMDSLTEASRVIQLNTVAI